MKLLLIFGSIFILSVYAADESKKFNVGYAKVTAENKLSLCGIDEEIKPIEGTNTVKAQLTIEDENRDVEVIDIPGTFTENNICIEFDYSTHTTLNGKKHDIFTKVTVDTIDNVKEAKNTVIEYEFKGIFTFTETNAESVGFKFYTSVNIVQFTNGNVPVFKVISNDPTTIIDQTSITCPKSPDICIHPYTTPQTPLAKDQLVEIYNAASDTIPISSQKTITPNDIITDCEEFTDISIVYDNDDTKNGYTFTGNDATKACAVSGTQVFYNLVGNIKPNSTPETFVVINNDKCEEITAKVRDMDFLKPFDNTVEVSWLHDDPKTYQNKYYLEVNGVTDATLIKNLHIDCSQDELTTCIAYVFDEEITDEDEIKFELSESVESVSPPTSGKMKTKETYTVPSSQPDGKKSLKTLNVNQFEINWNTKQGKLCLEDSLFKKSQKSQYKYELVIGFDEGNWKKHIANYNDESTTCFNDFEVTELIENKLGVHFLVMKRESDTNQIVASDMITTDLIVPEISEVNDETISLEFENLNSPFLIRDEKTKQIISKNEKKIHNLAFLKSSHEKKSIFNRNLVLETRKEHTQMKVHFKIPQKVNEIEYISYKTNSSVQTDFYENPTNPEKKKIMVRRIEKLEKGTRLLIETPVSMKVNTPIILYMNGVNYVGLTNQELKAGEEISVDYAEFDITLNQSPVNLAVAAGVDVIPAVLNLEFAESETQFNRVTKNSMRIKVAENDNVEDVSWCSKNEGICYGINEEILPQISVCKTLENNLDKDSSSVKFCQKVNSESKEPEPLSIAEIDIVSKESISYTSYQFGNPVEVVTYDNRTNKILNDYPYNCQMKGDDLCSTEITSQLPKEISHIVVLLDENNGVNKAVEFGSIIPEITQKTDKHLKFDLSNVKYSETEVTINDNKVKGDCNNGPYCIFYLESNSEDGTIKTKYEHDGILQKISTDFSLQTIESISDQLSVDRNWDQRIKTCFQIDVNQIYDVTVTKNNQQIDYNDDGGILIGKDRCLYSKNPLFFSNLIDVDVFVGIYDSKKLKSGGMVNFKAIFLSEDSYVFLASKEEGKLYSSWKLVDESKDMDKYELNILTERGLYDSKTISADTTEYNFDVKPGNSYSLCTKIISSKTNLKSEEICSFLVNVPVEPSDDLAPPVPDKVECAANPNSKAVLVTWDNEMSIDISHFITITSDIKFKVQRVEHIFVPPFQNVIELETSGTNTEICVSGVKDGEIGKDTCQSANFDGVTELKTPENVVNDEVEHTLSWDKIDEADKYILIFEKDDLKNHYTVEEPKFDYNSIEPGIWNVNVHAKNSEVISDNAMIELKVSGISIEYVQPENECLDISWEEIPHPGKRMTYKIKVEGNEQSIPCDPADEMSPCFAQMKSLTSSDPIIEISREKFVSGQKDAIVRNTQAPKLKQLRKLPSDMYEVSWEATPQAKYYKVQHWHEATLLNESEVVVLTFDLKAIENDTVKVFACFFESLCGGVSEQKLRIAGGNQEPEDTGVETWIIVISTVGGIIVVLAILGAIFITRSKFAMKKNKRSQVQSSNLNDDGFVNGSFCDDSVEFSSSSQSTAPNRTAVRSMPMKDVKVNEAVNPTNELALNRFRQSAPSKSSQSQQESYKPRGPEEVRTQRPYVNQEATESSSQEKLDIPQLQRQPHHDSQSPESSSPERWSRPRPIYSQDDSVIITPKRFVGPSHSSIMSEAPRRGPPRGFSYLPRAGPSSVNDYPPFERRQPVVIQRRFSIPDRYPNGRREISPRRPMPRDISRYRDEEPRFSRQYSSPQLQDSKNRGEKPALFPRPRFVPVKPMNLSRTGVRVLPREPQGFSQFPRQNTLDERF